MLYPRSWIAQGLSNDRSYAWRNRDEKYVHSGELVVSRLKGLAQQPNWSNNAARTPLFEIIFPEEQPSTFESHSSAFNVQNFNSSYICLVFTRKKSRFFQEHYGVGKSIYENGGLNIWLLRQAARLTCTYLLCDVHSPNANRRRLIKPAA